MDAGERDTVDRRDRNRIRDFAGGVREAFPALAAVEIASCVAWLKPFAITGTAAEILHWISYATASASMNSSPDAPACSAAARTGPKLSLGWQRPPSAM